MGAVLPTVCSVSVLRSSSPDENHSPHVVDFDCLNFEVDDLLCNRVEAHAWADGTLLVFVMSDREGDMDDAPEHIEAHFAPIARALLDT